MENINPKITAAPRELTDAEINDLFTPEDRALWGMVVSELRRGVEQANAEGRTLPGLND